jgi:hypothetical protein
LTLEFPKAIVQLPPVWILTEKIMKPKWQFIIASVVGLTGAFFGGVFGSLVAAFAGDSWWNSQSALKIFQFAIAFSGVCLGAVPGAVWLFCLRQKWVLPLFWVAGCGLLLPAFEMAPIRNDSKGLLYAGVVVSGFVVGFSLWVYGRRA